MSKPFKLYRRTYYSHLRPHLSISQINDYIFDPAYFKARHIDHTLTPEVTDHMKLGSMVDEFLTRRCAHSRFKVRVLKRDNPELWAKQQEDDRCVVSQALRDRAIAMIDYVKRQEFWKELKRDYKCEFQKVLARYDLFFPPVCGMPDLIATHRKTKQVLLIDFKVTHQAHIITPQKWFFHAKESGYFRQLAFYSRLMDKPPDVCLNIAFSEIRPGFFTVRIYEVAKPVLEEADREINEAMEGIEDRDYRAKTATLSGRVVVGEFVKSTRL